MPQIIIAPLQQVASALSGHEGAWVCGLLGPDMAKAHPDLPIVAESRRLRLGLHDVNEARAGFRAAQPQQVVEMVDFARRWHTAAQAGQAGALLVHCWFGISRSPAAAFIMQCALRADEDEAAIARELRALAPWATPNAHLVALADDLLGRQGRMRAAIAALGRGHEAACGEVVRWAVPEGGG